MRVRLNRLTAVALTAVGFLSLPARAPAETITLTLNADGGPVTYNPYGGAPVTVNGGSFNWSQSAPLNANFPSAVQSYCIDLDRTISKGGTYEFSVHRDLKVAPTIGTDAKAAMITKLFDHYYKDSLTSADKGAAFQLALWELLYDTDRSLTNGRVQDDVTTGDGKDAQSLLDRLNDPHSNHDLDGYELLVLVSADGSQNQLVVVPKTVPAPPALVLAGIGALALMGRARWNRRTPR